MNVATMKLDRRCFFMVYFMAPITCSYLHINISQYDLFAEYSTVPKPESYFVDREGGGGSLGGPQHRNTAQIRSRTPHHRLKKS